MFVHELFEYTLRLLLVALPQTPGGLGVTEPGTCGSSMPQKQHRCVVCVAVSHAAMLSMLVCGWCGA
jgi:hypothetical protein